MRCPAVSFALSWLISILLVGAFSLPSDGLVSTNNEPKASGTGGTGWVKQMEYSGTTFFDGWDFFSETDPSNGLVRLRGRYVNSEDAFSRGLAFWTQDGIPGIQTDHWTDLPVGKYRESVRITTRQLFAGGLFIIDVKLMPWGCGVWPAFWTLGYNGTWPLAGEIDIIEGIQAMTQNQMTVHTKSGCIVDRTLGKFSGQLLNPACDRASGGTGCSIISSSPISYGEQFNAQGGGVFAMQWDGEGIKMWNWIRKDIPLDITHGQPSPAGWGLPVAAWGAATCNPYEYFKPQTLILNINLCGDWAGQLYHQYSYCPGSCAQQIANPRNLNNAIWLINSIKVYQRQGQAPITGEAPTNANLTGSPGPVAVIRDPIRSGAGSKVTGLGPVGTGIRAICSVLGLTAVVSFI